MADTKTTALTELTAALTSDILYIVDDPGGTPLSKKITLANLGVVLLNDIAATGSFTVTTDTSPGKVSIIDSNLSQINLGTTNAASLRRSAGDTNLLISSGLGDLYLRAPDSEVIIIADDSNAGVSLCAGGGNVGIGLSPTANMSGLSIEQGLLTLKERATPTADTNYGKIYTKTDNILYFQDGSGVEAGLGGLVKLAMVELSESATTMDFSTIAQTYKHLLLIGSLRTDHTGSNFDTVRMRVNNNSTADDYVAECISGSATTAAAAEYVTDEVSAPVSTCTSADATARYFGGFSMHIYDYTDANKAPHWTSQATVADGVDTGDVLLYQYGGMLDVAGAVTRLTFLPTSGTNFVEHSVISLYGIR